MKHKIVKNDVILFQGDSITDCERNTSTDGLGNGYVSIIRGLLQVRHPNLPYKVINRGVGGDRTTELLARWLPDCLDLKPSLLSIMVGVNDVWRYVGEYQGQTWNPPALFESNYRQLLDLALQSGIETLVLMSPTTIENEANVELSRQLDERTETVKRLAKEYKAVYVPSREATVVALRSAPQVAWTLDGCHPNVAGHGLIAATWLQAMGL